MAGFEPRISGIRSDRSTNCATTTALCSGIVYSKNVIIESHFTAMDALSHCLVVIGVDS